MDVAVSVCSAGIGVFVITDSLSAIPEANSTDGQGTIVNSFCRVFLSGSGDLLLQDIRIYLCDDCNRICFCGVFTKTD